MIADARARLCSAIVNLYGSTEAGWVTLLRPHEQIERLGTVGREWAGSGPIRLLDPQGREVADGAAIDTPDGVAGTVLGGAPAGDSVG